MSVHSLRLTELEAKLEQLESDKRLTTLVIDGIMEKDDEDPVELTEALFKDVGVDYDTRVCVNLYRRGKCPSVGAKRADTEYQQQSRPRIIVVLLKRLNYLVIYIKRTQGE